jgi:long-chain acyl-CoA synthetase
MAAERAGQDVTVPYWSTDLERIDVGGVPFTIYREREHSLLRFLEIARRWGDRIYLVQADGRWTIKDVGTAVERRATALAEMGLEPGMPAVVLGWNSIDWIVAFWSILRAGGFVVTANAWWSDEELEHALGLARPALVLTDRPERIPQRWTTVSFADVATAPEPSTPLPQPPTDESATALAMFTSGTTGFPKAGVFTHRAIIAGIHSQLALTKRLPQLLPADHPGEVTLQTAPLFHIGGVQAILRTALVGGRLVLTRGKFDPGEVLQLIEREGVQRWPGAVPTMAMRVAEHPDVDAHELSSVRSVTLGSTDVPAPAMQRVRELFPNARERVGTGWGLTETGGQLTAASGREVLERPGHVGRALPFVELRILEPDADGVGEVLARSPMQMACYLGEDSSSVIDDEGWLHTGDLGRIDESGLLWLVGRSKDLIVRGGENVAPARVEQVLLEHEDVADAAVVGLPDPELGEIVGAVVVLRPGATATREEMTAFAAARLSRFAVPTAWWLRDAALPVNDVGKIAKAVLRETFPVATPEVSG